MTDPKKRTRKIANDPKLFARNLSSLLKSHKHRMGVTIKGIVDAVSPADDAFLEFVRRASSKGVSYVHNKHAQKLDRLLERVGIQSVDWLWQYQPHDLIGRVTKDSWPTEPKEFLATLAQRNPRRYWLVTIFFERDQLPQFRREDPNYVMDNFLSRNIADLLAKGDVDSALHYFETWEDQLTVTKRTTEELPEYLRTPALKSQAESRARIAEFQAKRNRIADKKRKERRGSEAEAEPASTPAAASAPPLDDDDVYIGERILCQECGRSVSFEEVYNNTCEACRGV